MEKRVIKFRAWHSQLKTMFSAEEMAQDQLTLLPTGKFINVSGASTKLSQVIEIMIPLQYTGLKDKNGKEIYEGDIFHMGDRNIKYVVEWFDGGLRGRQITNKSSVGFSYWQDRIEIIGNIYEQPQTILLAAPAEGATLIEGKTI